MGKKLYVGNLAYSVNDSDLEQLFEAHGTVQSAQVIMDRDTGRSKGFGFVREWLVRSPPDLGLNRRGRQYRRDGVEIGMADFSTRTSRRLACQPP